MVHVNGKKVATNSIVIEGVDRYDYPDFCDAYASKAEFEDGTPLTSTELDSIDKGVIQELAAKTLEDDFE
jgi:hypothetical protein